MCLRVRLPVTDAALLSPCRCIDIVAGLAISSAGHIVVVDSVTPTVFVIAENGSLIKWFDCSNYMREPSDIVVSGKRGTEERGV